MNICDALRGGSHAAECSIEGHRAWRKENFKMRLTSCWNQGPKKIRNLLETRRALRERRPPSRPSHILNNMYKLDKNKLKKWKVLSWQLNNSNFMELTDRIYEEFQMLLLQSQA